MQYWKLGLSRGIESEADFFERGAEGFERVRPHAVELRQFRFGDAGKLFQVRVASGGEGAESRGGELGERSFWRGVHEGIVAP